MWLERLSGGNAPLITLADAKDKLRIIAPEGEDPELDAELTRAIAAASAHLDVDADGFGGLGFPLVAQQWLRRGEGFSADLLRLPFARILSVEALRYRAEDGNIAVVPPQDYVLAGQGRLRRIALLPGRSWPVPADRPDAVEVAFTAGFETVAAVPEDIKAAARELVVLYYDHPLADAALGIPRQVQEGIDRLTRRYRAFAA
ncbi:head-tail connector protein [Antarcticimicrobium luteum]|uniref:PhiE125 gp8 family phage protein n=1 Tax=Antarcticimicrobium luteum TaxID=2547397 RepID=A0A4R5VFH5_9RHOB|nr:hypothetical protein [Antarcticimicrobium luteum]TDK51142.1 hypothetical protein E1832_04000 [Antarcticimicrobium luteum]